MRLVRLFHSQPPQLGLNWLEEAAAHKVGKVLRMRVGDAVELVCGDGRNYRGAIAQCDKKAVVAEIVAIADNPCTPTLPLHLYMALIKGEQQDWVLQKAVELGATAIVPLMTARSERELSAERWLKKQQHWQGILTAAALQCGRAEWPVLSAPQPFDETLGAPCALNIMLSPHNEAVLELPSQIDSVALMIGPEGGFTVEEVALACGKGWQTQLLGNRILRADTAAVAAMTAVQLNYGEFKTW